MSIKTQAERFDTYTKAQGHEYPARVDVGVNRGTMLNRLNAAYGPLPSSGLSRCFDHAFIAGKYFCWGPSAEADAESGRLHEWCIVTEPYLDAEERAMFIEAMALNGIRVECLDASFWSYDYPALVATLTDPEQGWALFAELGRFAHLGDASAFMSSRHAKTTLVILPE